MRHIIIGVSVFVCVLVGFASTRIGVHPVSTARATAALPPAAGSALGTGDYLVAAPGRVEPVSEEIHVAGSTTGVLRDVLVNSGDKVHRGDVLAHLENGALAAALAKAKASLALEKAELDRVVNGARPAERDGALAAVDEADAVEKAAHAELDRRLGLVGKGVVTREALEQAQRDFDVAHQRTKVASAKYALLNDPPRQEDVEIAKARVEAGQAEVDQARAELEKTVVRSPIDGTVLRVDRHAGELVSTLLADQSIVTLGDLSTLDVRAEVDEADIAKVAVGQVAYVTAGAFGTKRFPGKVIRVGEMLGRKRVFTGDPTERTDVRVLEVLIELDEPGGLRPGLRVDTFVQQAPQSSASSG